jgi:hypothetical protein
LGREAPRERRAVALKALMAAAERPIDGIIPPSKIVMVCECSTVTQIESKPSPRLAEPRLNGRVRLGCIWAEMRIRTTII